MEVNLEGMQFRLSLPGYHVTGGFDVKYVSDENGEADFARLSLSEELQGFLKDKEKNQWVLELGNVSGGYETLVRGTGFFPEDTEDTLVIREETEAKQEDMVQFTFLDVSIREAAKYICDVFGVQAYSVTDKDYGRRKLFTIRAESCMDALMQLNGVFMADLNCYRQNGVVYFGTTPEQGAFYRIEDNTVLELEKNGGIWMAEILPVPWIHVRQRIFVDCTEYAGTARVSKVVIEGGEDGIDMRIEFREETDG